MSDMRKPKLVTISGSFAEDLRRAIIKRKNEQRELEAAVWRQIGKYWSRKITGI